MEEVDLGAVVVPSHVGMVEVDVVACLIHSVGLSVAVALEYLGHERGWQHPPPQVLYAPPVLALCFRTRHIFNDPVDDPLIASLGQGMRRCCWASVLVSVFC